MTKEISFKKIIDGTYRVGNLIAPLTYIVNKFKYCEIVEEEITICGRKISIFGIRKDMLQSQFKYMRLQSDEELEALKHEDIVQFFTRIHEYQSDDLTKSSQEHLQQMKIFKRTCNLIFWHDGSTLSSHGSILVMVARMHYDAVFMTNEEDFQLTGISTEIQPEIEKPYFISLKESLTTKDGITIFDVARALKGDHPATQYEAGQQKGSNYACHACNID